MRVIVTRPAAQATGWVEHLRATAIDAVALPLIAIEPLADPTPLVQAWRDLAAQRLVVFVSPNAALQFFAQRSGALGWPASTLAGSPGPGTTQALLAGGVPARQVVEPAPDAVQFDSEALWLQLQGHDWRDADVLIVRGDGGRDWLARTLRAAGARVTHVAAYRRAAPVLDRAQSLLLQAALERPAQHLWLFSSSEAIDHLVNHLTTLSQPVAGALARASAIATHPRIAERARQAGFGRVVDARPSPAAVVACIQSLRP